MLSTDTGNEEEFCFHGNRLVEDIPGIRHRCYVFPAPDL